MTCSPLLERLPRRPTCTMHMQIQCNPAVRLISSVRLASVQYTGVEPREMRQVKTTKYTSEHCSGENLYSSSCSETSSPSPPVSCQARADSISAASRLRSVGICLPSAVLEWKICINNINYKIAERYTKLRKLFRE